MRRALRIALVGLVVGAGACNPKEQTTAPSGAAASGSVTVETFTGTLAVNGVRFYSFSVPTAGVVYLTLINLTANGAPTDVRVGIGLGVPSGTDCRTSNTLTVPVSAAPQLTGVLQPGVYCARIFDQGGMTVPLGFSLNIGHPR